MRKDRMTERTASVAMIARYHGGNHETNKLFTSDRYEILDSLYRRESRKPYKGFGLEIETECFAGINAQQYADVIEHRIYDLFPADLFKMERDASLGGSGASASAEIITQIMTKEFIRNHYRDFKAMFDSVFPLWNISAAQTGNCGMHINISNQCFGATKETQDKAIRKLYYFINHHFSLACSLVRRDERRTGYCGRMQHEKNYCKSLDLENGIDSHRICFNLGHYNEGQGRIELRLVGGQKNFASFRNTMETVFHLIDACKSLSWDDMDDMKKVFKGCNRYVYDRLTLAQREGKISAGDMVNIAANMNADIEYL